MKKHKLIRYAVIGVLLLLAILVDININWWWRGYPAFGGEGLLYLLAIGGYTHHLIEVIRS